MNSGIRHAQQAAGKTGEDAAECLQERVGSALKGVLLLQENVRLYHAALRGEADCPGKTAPGRRGRSPQSRFLSMVESGAPHTADPARRAERNDAAARGIGQPAALTRSLPPGSGPHRRNRSTTGRARAGRVGPHPQPGRPVAAGDQAGRIATALQCTIISSVSKWPTEQGPGLASPNTRRTSPRCWGISSAGSR